MLRVADEGRSSPGAGKDWLDAVCGDVVRKKVPEALKLRAQSPRGLKAQSQQLDVIRCQLGGVTSSLALLGGLRALVVLVAACVVAACVVARFPAVSVLGVS